MIYVSINPTHENVYCCVINFKSGDKIRIQGKKKNKSKQDQSKQIRTKSKDKEHRNILNILKRDFLHKGIPLFFYSFRIFIHVLLLDY